MLYFYAFVTYPERDELYFIKSKSCLAITRKYIEKKLQREMLDVAFSENENIKDCILNLRLKLPKKYKKLKPKLIS